MVERWAPVQRVVNTGEEQMLYVSFDATCVPPTESGTPNETESYVVVLRRVKQSTLSKVPGLQTTSLHITILSIFT